jgi:transposase
MPAVMTVNGAPEAEVLRTDVTPGLGPTLVPAALVGLANLAAHNVTGIQQALARRRARLLSRPPYSPDLSPMELGVSTSNTALRAAKARTREALDAAVQQAMETVTALEARNWFGHCGDVLS